MRVLLDECLPSGLARELVGHDVGSVTSVGWSGIKHGELLRLAAQDYEVFLTIDQRLARQEHVLPGLAVITLVAPTNRIESLRPLVPSARTGRCSSIRACGDYPALASLCRPHPSCGNVRRWPARGPRDGLAVRPGHPSGQVIPVDGISA